MALSGSVNTSSYDGRYYRLSWSATQSVEDNKSTVSWTLEALGGSSSWYAERTLTVTIAGTSVYSKSARVERYKGTVASGSITVAHNSAGEASFSVSIQAAVYTSSVNCTGSGSFTLDTIPRATTPVLSASSADMGSSVTITLNRASSSFTHDLAYSFNGASYVSIATGVGTSYNWTVPDTASSIPNASSGTLTIRCITKNGSTTIGTKTVTMTAKVPASVVPTIDSVTVTEATSGLAAQFGAFVQGKSTLSVKVTASGAKGSSISSYRTTFQGNTYTAANFTTDAVVVHGSVNLVTTVTDSRGRTAKKTTSVTVLEYSAPSTYRLNVYRCDANGVAQDDGVYLALIYDYEVSSLGGKNTAKMVVEYKRQADSDYSVPLYSNTALAGMDTVTITSPTFSTDYRYDIRMTVTDWFGASTSYVATLPTAKVIFDIGADGLSFAFGKTAEMPGLEVDMPPGGESLHLVGVRDYEIGDGYGHLLYNNGLLLQWGTVSVVPTAANAVTSVQIMFPKPYKLRPHIMGALQSNIPQVVTWGVGGGTTAEAALTSMMLYMTRTNVNATAFRWMAVGLADMTGEVV